MKAAPNCRLIGDWRIIDADIWDCDFLDLVEPAMIAIGADGVGEIAFAALEANLVVRYSESVVHFPEAGFDELDEVLGDGHRELADDGAIKIAFTCHNADEALLKAKRRAFATARRSRAQGRTGWFRFPETDEIMENVQLFASTDWAKTELGPLSTWPDEMRGLVETALQTHFPVCLAWGDELVQIYNDGYNRIYGDKHPRSFGSPARDSWPEIWPFLKPALDTVRGERRAHQFTNYLLPLRKSEAIEECYFTFCYSPIVAANGSVSGVMSIAMETTREAIDSRRFSLTNLIVDAASYEPSPISFKLRDHLADNEIDAKMAFVLHSYAGKVHVEWVLRGDEAFATYCSSVLEKEDPNPCGIIELPHVPHLRRGYADYLGYVRFRSVGGDGTKCLMLWPSDLVTKESMLDLVKRVEARLRAMVSQLENFSRIRNELAQSDLLYRFLFENTVDGVVYSSTGQDVSSDEVIRVVNEAASSLLGYGLDEMVGMKREDFFFSEDEELKSALMQRSEHNVFNGELTFRHKSGRPLTLDITSVLVELNAKERRSISILRDVSRKVRQERERAEISRLEAIAKMTSGISHDFNNLLTIILASAEHLNASLYDPAQKEIVCDIVTASHRAANLTSQLLAYSRKQNFHSSLVEVNAAIHEIERLLRGLVPKEIDIIYNYAGLRLVAFLDLAQFTSAIVNMVKNADEALPAGGGILISTAGVEIGESESTSQLKSGKYVAVTISDTGEGIPRSIMTRIFDPFFTTKGNKGGSGLGLSMVQGFARQTGGDIQIQSEVGKGTTARIYLPWRDHATATAEPQHIDAKRAPSTDGHVLVVDDDPLIRRQITRILRSLGMKYAEAGSAVNALELIRKRPRLVISDLVMPGAMSGLDVVEACRRDDPPIPVILMSGFAADVQWEGATSDHPSMISKPFSRDLIVCAIKAHLPDLEPGNQLGDL